MSVSHHFCKHPHNWRIYHTNCENENHCYHTTNIFIVAWHEINCRRPPPYTNTNTNTPNNYAPLYIICSNIVEARVETSNTIQSLEGSSWFCRCWFANFWGPRYRGVPPLSWFPRWIPKWLQELSKLVNVTQCIDTISTVRCYSQS